MKGEIIIESLLSAVDVNNRCGLFLFVSLLLVVERLEMLSLDIYIYIHVRSGASKRVSVDSCAHWLCAMMCHSPLCARVERKKKCIESANSRNATSTHSFYSLAGGAHSFRFSPLNVAMMRRCLTFCTSALIICVTLDELILAMIVLFWIEF